MTKKPERVYYYRGQIERLAATRAGRMTGYTMVDGWSANDDESGCVLYPWLTRGEVLAEAARDGVFARWNQEAGRCQVSADDLDRAIGEQNALASATSERDEARREIERLRWRIKDYGDDEKNWKQFAACVCGAIGLHDTPVDLGQIVYLVKQAVEDRDKKIADLECGVAAGRRAAHVAADLRQALFKIAVLVCCRDDESPIDSVRRMRSALREEREAVESMRGPFVMGDYPDADAEYLRDHPCFTQDAGAARDCESDGWYGCRECTKRK